VSVRDPLLAIVETLAQRGRPPGTRPVSCFVALGDSFTAGTGCAPGERWADRLAQSLRAVHHGMGYRNLAAHGAASEDVLAQVPRALQLEPDLITAICGANDVLSTVRPDVDAYASSLSAILERLRRGAPGAALLTATTPESWRFLELRRRTRARVVEGIRRVNEATRAVARAHGVECLDVAGHPGLADARNFSPDGLHPSAIGHARAAAEFAGVIHSRFGIASAMTMKEEP
jgi:phosphatidylinositol alpha 1,6-mannosyltransferase